MTALGPFEPRPHVAVAVSGGADSLALLLLAQAWARACGGQVTALHVDHRLRPESSAEAERLAGLLVGLGVAHERLAWSGAKPSSGLQAAAREARYAALAAACRSRLILHLLLGHQADDQAETMAMRAARSDRASDAGMPAIRELAAVRLLRPLLTVPRARLRATVMAAGHPWLSDPSNADERFERARLRLDQDFAVEGWLAFGVAAAEARRAREAAVTTFLATTSTPHPLGFVRAPARDWLETPADLVESALARVLVTIGGAVYPPTRAALARILAGLRAGPEGRVSLGGCLITRRGTSLLVSREPGRIVERWELAPFKGENASDSANHTKLMVSHAERAVRLRVMGNQLWDGRFEIAAESHRIGMAAWPAPSLVIAALAEAGRRQLPAALTKPLREAGVPAVAVAALPGIWQGDDLIACPSLGWCRPDQPSPPVRAYFRPRVALIPPPFALANVV